MKRWVGFLFLYAIMGGVTWLVIDAEHEHSASPLEAAAAPVAPHASLSKQSTPVSVPTRAPLTPWLSEIGQDLNQEFRCLALNVYWEARSESSLGQFAVAAVTLNRVAHERFPDTICEVVRQGGADRKHRCQFSWWCDGKSDDPTNQAAWQAAQSIAYTTLFFDPPDPTGGALWYHADYVNPSWSKAMSLVTTIGRHIYYRKPARGEIVASRY